MIEVKQAVSNAVQFVVDMFGREQVHDIRLEEVELSENDELWYITLSFLRNKPKASGSLLPVDIQGMLASKREYKILEVQSADGQVKSMKIRQIPQLV